MAEEIRIPKLGMSAQEMTLVEWMFGDGEQVTAGDVLYTVETDKTTVEVQAQAGTGGNAAMQLGHAATHLQRPFLVHAREAKAQGHEAIFCKGGDRHAGNIPEMTILNKHGAKLIDGLGAKIDSSSRIIAAAKKPSA